MLLTWSKDHVALSMGACHCKSEPSLVCSSWIFCRWRYDVFSLSRDLTWSPHWACIQIYGWELLGLCHWTDKSCPCDHKHCGGGNIMLFNLSCNFSWTHVERIIWIHGSKPVTLSHHLTTFGSHWSIANGNKYSIWRVTLQNHVIEGSSNFMSESSSWYVTTLSSLVKIGIKVVQIQCF